MRQRHRGPLVAARIAAVALVLLMVLPGNGLSLGVGSLPSRDATRLVGSAPESRSFIKAALGRINVTLAVNATGLNLSDQFWGTTVTNEVHVLRGETNAINATPARVIVWPGAMAGEDYDPFTNTHWDEDTGIGTPALTNESQFVQMCRAIHCTAIMQVPAEIDNPSIAEAIVNYTEVNLSFHPAYWMIGNEPELWSHWKEPWKDWKNSYSGGPDPTQFGEEVVAYVNAIRHVDNTTPILGLPASGCTCGYYTYAQWISGVLKVTGSKIQAVAFHEYPAGWLGTGDGSLLDFYGTLQSAANIPTRVVAARQAIQSACPGCNVSLFISELGSALSWSAYGQYAAGFSGALSIASQLTQAMDYNVSNIDLFASELNTTNSWFNTLGGMRPDYNLYSEILDHLGTDAYSVNASGLSHTIYAIDTVAPADQDRRDLLVVNDNITHSIVFAPEFAGGADPPMVMSWSWNGSIHNTRSNDTTWVEPYTLNPVPQEYPGGLPYSYTLPPQSMVLFEGYPAGGSYVQVLESNVPSGVPWYADVGSQLHRTIGPNISLLLSPGAYPVSSIPIPLPIGGREWNPDEQLGPSVASPLEVDGPAANVTVNFGDQWRVTAGASPAVGGNVTPSVGWWNASEPLNLTATPATGYAFDRWSGWGPGSYNGTGRTITIDPGGRIVEQALFVPGLPVHFLQYNVPSGTPWSVTVRGFTTASTGEDLTVYEPYGQYGYVVNAPPGWRSVPKYGGFTVDGSSQLVEIEFERLTPPPPDFPVNFEVTGLPNGTVVPVTVRGSTIWVGPSDPPFLLLNGSYAYQVGYVPGYHADGSVKLFDVTGGPLTVVISFVQTVYAATWQASGTRAGLNWTVVVNGTAMQPGSAWVSTRLPNGTYPYSIDAPANFSVSPRSGAFSITGGAMVVPILFSLVEFPTWFLATGPGASLAWSVRLGNQSVAVAGGRAWLLAPNGTYTFDVHPPAGYYAIPSHGNLTVAGPVALTGIRFHLLSEQPSPALIASLDSGALSVSIWLGLAVVGGFASFRSLRGRGG